MRATHFLNVPTFIEENPEQSGGRKSAIETEKLSMKKMISWNVNGLRACLGKGFLEYLKESDADIFCIQESKLQVTYGLGIEEHDHEGRVITAEFPEYYVVTCYTPNSQDGLKRLDYRMQWEDAFRAYLKELETKKPVIFCGDLNVAHQEIDLKNPKTNRKNAGFSDEERAKFTELLEAGFVDTFRYFYPDQEGIYSWWSYRFSARAKNAGWRIDYFCVSESLKDRLVDAKIHTEVMGSDHCPVELDIQ